MANHPNVVIINQSAPAVRRGPRQATRRDTNNNIVLAPTNIVLAPAGEMTYSADYENLYREIMRTRRTRNETAPETVRRYRLNLELAILIVSGLGAVMIWDLLFRAIF